MGKREAAQEILDNLIEYSKGNFVSGVELAVICAALGEKDQAFNWLEKAFRERDPYLLNLNNYFSLDPLRSDARFTDLLKRMGLEK
jgi:tetratricopeptide (TPR) repeat protein